MGKLLESLLNLQSIERQLAQVRRRLKSRKQAVALQQRRIDQLREDWNALHERSLRRRAEADSLSVDLQEKEDHVSKLRGMLNTAKTNKEYAAILTQLNTFKADNAKVEEQALNVMQEADVIKVDADKVQEEIGTEEKRLGEIQQSNEEEIARLDAMLDDLSNQRKVAAGEIDSEALGAFNRIAVTYEGEAMARIEVQGNKPPFSYVCGGCYMSLNAEHANALRVRDEIRHCDNCGRILYMEPKAEQSPTT